MPRRAIGGLLIAVVASLNVLAFLRAAGGESCACVKAACCCAPKRAQPTAACHGGEPDAHQAGLRCRHASDALLLASTVGAPPPALSVDPMWGTADADQAPSAAPRDGFFRLHSPPPRPPLAS